MITVKLQVGTDLQQNRGLRVHNANWVKCYLKDLEANMTAKKQLSGSNLPLNRAMPTGKNLQFSLQGTKLIMKSGFTEKTRVPLKNKI